MTRPSKPSAARPAASARPARGGGQVRIIGGRFKRSKLEVADRPGLRPTPDRVRETVFNWLGQQLDGWRCIDLFAGSGALGLEAASRGAGRVELVERDPELAALLRANAQRLGADAVTVHARDALQFAAAQPAAAFDLVFIDPPFAASGLHRQALDAAARLLRSGGLAYLETPNAELEASLTADSSWDVLRQARAGTVHYALLRRTDAPVAAD